MKLKEKNNKQKDAYSMPRLLIWRLQLTPTHTDMKRYVYLCKDIETTANNSCSSKLGTRGWAGRKGACPCYVRIFKTLVERWASWYRINQHLGHLYPVSQYPGSYASNPAFLLMQSCHSAFQTNVFQNVEMYRFQKYLHQNKTYLKKIYFLLTRQSYKRGREVRRKRERIFYLQAPKDLSHPLLTFQAIHRQLHWT